MNHERSLRDFAGAVRASIPGGGRALPPQPQFIDLLEIAFATSLYVEEEGRPTEVGLAWLEREEFGVLRLAEPVPALPARIAKLAPAAERDRTPLAIARAIAQAGASQKGTSPEGPGSPADNRS
jgi:hypothetical protein